MEKKKHVIWEVTPGSIADEMELEKGDILLSINGKEIEDVFDYQYLVEDEYITVVVRKANGEEWEMEIEKDADEDLGVTFENGLMDDYKSCHNKCIFCFIDQMPPGMRDTLYFKDDDSRLSFLQGNYVTLTNMKEHDIERIIEYHLGPINISVQTTNPQLRCMMLHNRFAGEALEKMVRLKEAGIPMNGQIVLCKGVNDGAELERTISDLTKMMPEMESVSIVPVGISKYREGLYEMQPFEKEDAKEVLKTVHKWQKKCMQEHGVHFIHCSDEWYLLAEEDLPSEENYDGYLQLENGVGMLTLLHDEFEEGLAVMEAPKHRPKKVTIATGRLAAPTMETLAKKCMAKYPDLTIEVIAIRNDFFGESITVSGLITGQDLLAQLKDVDLGEKLLLPCNMLRSTEAVFLDDITLEEVKKTLQVKVDIVKSSGQDLVRAMISETCNES